MFKNSDLKNSKLVSKDDYNKIIKYLDKIKRETTCNFLKDIDYKNINFKRCKAMNVDTGVLGAYSYLHKNDIYLFEIADIEQIFSTIVHELRHKWQHQKYSVLYYILCLPVLRQFTIEKDVKPYENYAEEFIKLEELKK